MDTSRILSIVAAILFAVMITKASAQQPHIHGQTAVDWYDSACCSNNDCKPVDDADIEFGADALGNTYARYKPTGHTFYKYQFKPSQDERYHVCINPNAVGNNGALCFYDRSGV